MPTSHGLGLSMMTIDPLSLDDILVFIGDSRTAFGYVAAGANFGNYLKGFTTWSHSLSGGKLFIPAGGNKGVSGDTVAMIQARQAAILALRPAAAILLAGTNDLAAGTSAATISASLGAPGLPGTLIGDLFAGGLRHLILFTELPRGAPNALTAPQEAERVALNALIMAKSGPRVHVVDAAPLWVPAVHAYDGLHENVLGASLLGQLAGNVLASVTTGADIFGAFVNAYAQNPTMAGSGGSMAGGATGTAPDNFTVDATNAGGATVAALATVANDNRACLQLSLSGTYTGSGRGVVAEDFKATGTDFAAGDKLELISEVEYAGLNAAIIELKSSISVYNSDFSTVLLSAVNSFGDSGTYGSYPAGYSRQVLRTPVGVIQAGTPFWRTIQFAVNLKDTGGTDPVTGTVRFIRNALRKVA